MRLGGPVFEKYESPDQWVAAVQALGYRAAYCPLETDAAQADIQAYAAAARKADLVIAEVGAWSNPLSRDDATRRAAVERCKKSLALADAIGARCCVNIAGSGGAFWCGPGESDLTVETFQQIVEVVRDIIDAVRPQHTFYTLETMPWLYPDSTDAYLELIRAIDRPAFAVHFDPVNLINCPRLYFRSGDVIRDFIQRLGPRIRSCHAKDIVLQDGFAVHFDEVRPGQGRLDYRAYLSGLATLDRDVPLMLEHLPDAGEYKLAAAYIRQVASSVQVAC